MGMYNILFGRNPLSSIILAMLGLRTKDVGRFRDAFVSGGKIAVYTRNGGGNRHCWHEDGDWYASEDCKHESRVVEVDETVEATEDEANKHSGWTPVNIYVGNKRVYKTGGMVSQKQYRCLNPNSPDCACPGCIIKHRMPKHPNYLYDEDDDFDCTYATIYFSFPEKYRQVLEKIDSGEFNPDARWQEKFNEIGSSSKDELKSKYPELVSLVEELANVEG